jgi:hypothetical protein
MPWLTLLWLSLVIVPIAILNVWHYRRRAKMSIESVQEEEEEIIKELQTFNM